MKILYTSPFQQETLEPVLQWAQVSLLFSLMTQPLLYFVEILELMILIFIAKSSIYSLGTLLIQPLKLLLPLAISTVDKTLLTLFLTLLNDSRLASFLHDR